MSAPLSNELFFNVHRGIAVGSEGTDQQRSVGMHWSANHHVAESFAVDNAEPGHTKPVILHAQVPLSSVETDTGTLEDKEVGGHFSGEQEVPVGSGNKIRITGRTTLRQDKNIAPEDVKKNRYRYPRSRTRTYNPPREATA